MVHDVHLAAPDGEDRLRIPRPWHTEITGNVVRHRRYDEPLQ
ncbi:hypothetical protein ABT330_05225 [Streptomyces sp. NPDC000658]